MDHEDFDPSKTVILESTPNPAPTVPQEDQKGSINIIKSSTDYSIFEIDLSSPAILLVTDVWSKNWRATALEGSSQTEYQTMPADYTLIGIPMNAGHHHFRLEYMPTAYQWGKWISIASLVVFLTTILIALFTSRRADQR
jgi:uncharacterized membrane protein YfhO